MKLLMIFLFVTLNVAAQTNGIKVQYEVFYNFENPMSREIDLYFNEQKSYGIEKMNTSKELGSPKETDKLSNLEQSESASNNIIEIKPNWKDVYLAVIKESNKLYKSEQDLKLGHFVTVEDIPIINWSMTKETKLINNLKCAKATAKFRGVIWEAWFTSEIPMSFGPWKLNGLPGLILEAKTSDSKVHYLAKNISYNINLPPFALPNKNIKPLKEYIQIIDEAGNYEYATDRNTVVSLKSETRNPLELIYEWEEEPKKE